MRVPISLIVAFVVSVLVFAWWYVSRGAVSQTDTPVDTTVFTFPVSAPSNTSQQEMKMREAFVNFLLTPDASHKWTTFSADDGKSLPLKDFTRALKVQVEPGIERLLNQYNWRFYQCGEVSVDDSVDRNIVLSLRFSLQDNYSGDLYIDQTRSLLSWERTLFNDVANIIFPYDLYGEVLSKGEFSTVADEPQVTLRVAPVQFASGQSGELGYVFVGDELLVGSSRECLLEAQELLFDTGA